MFITGLVLFTTIAGRRISHIFLAPRTVRESERNPFKLDVIGALTATLGATVLVFGGMLLLPATMFGMLYFLSQYLQEVAYLAASLALSGAPAHWLIPSPSRSERAIVFAAASWPRRFLRMQERGRGSLQSSS